MCAPKAYSAAWIISWMSTITCARRGSEPVSLMRAGVSVSGSPGSKSPSTVPYSAGISGSTETSIGRPRSVKRTSRIHGRADASK